MRNRSWSQSHAALLAARAAEMRAAPSAPEAVLWAALVNRKLDGVAFRRQVPLAGYICDFVAASRRLVVEVDGRQHERCAAADARRDRKLERLGYRVLRIPAQVVMMDLSGPLARVREALRVSAANKVKKRLPVSRQKVLFMPRSMGRSAMRSQEISLL